MKVHWRQLTFLLLAVGLLFVFTLDVNAQCSVCKAALAGSNNAKLLRSFNTAVLVLLVPPVTIFCSIFIVLKRHARGNDVDNQSQRNSE